VRKSSIRLTVDGLIYATSLPRRPAKAYTAGIVLACSKFDASRRQAGEIAARQNDLFGTAPTIIGKARHNVPNGGTVRAGRASRNR
jgi:hypothetical protein